MKYFRRLSKKFCFLTQHCVGLFLALSVVSLQAMAESDRAATEQVSAQLIASVDAVSPGEKIWVGLQQKIIPHWHTYWINPGDSGLPTKINWQLPAGASAGDIQWPTPTRFDQEGITNYGYADDVILLTKINLPENLTVGKNIVLAAKVDWLVCADVCIPQTVNLALELPVVAANAASDKKPINNLIADAIKQLPQSANWQAQTEVHEQALQLRIGGAAKQLGDVQALSFFADTWGRIEHAAAQSYRVDGDDIVIDLKTGDSKLARGESLNGLLKVTRASGAIESFVITAPVTSGVVSGGGVAQKGNVAAAPSSQGEPLNLWSAVLLALAGGVILNLMPCVFPVLSIKALALIKHGHHTALQNRLHGLTYTAGIVISFLLFAVLLLVLKAGGAELGWGFQYQSPAFVVAVAYLLFAVALNLSGVFELGTSITNTGAQLATKSGYAGSFFTGALAAIVATPCTAPFMGAAIGFALSQPALPLIAIFVSLGLGLALPYLLLTFWPRLQRRLPKPGRWMELFKQALAFPLYAAAVWLIWVLAQQTSADAVAIALGGMVAIALAAWLFQNSRNAATVGRIAGATAAIIVVIAALASGYFGVNDNARAAENSRARVAENAAGDEKNYSSQRLQQLRAEGKPVFVNFTAAWCISCLVNERVALKQSSVVAAFAEQGIVYLKGDWTNRDAEISAKLAEFGRSGVPLYLYFPAGPQSEPVVLPQILTPDIVLSAIDAANGKRLSSTQ